jgi:hypothetical protein
VEEVEEEEEEEALFDAGEAVSSDNACTATIHKPRNAILLQALLAMLC